MKKVSKKQKKPEATRLESPALPLPRETSARYFVTVYATTTTAVSQLEALGKQLDLDLFQWAAPAAAEEGYAVSGLLTLNQAAELVHRGYRVLLEEPASNRSRAQTEIGTFQDWLSASKLK